MQKNRGRYVGISAVHDYVYRPEIYDDTNLYEWVQRAKRVKKPSQGQRANVTVSEDELDVLGQVGPQSRVLRKSKPPAYIESDMETDELNLQEGHSDIEDSDPYSDSESDSDQEPGDEPDEFLEGHPLHETHGVEFDPRKHDVVPNFVGGSLPRRDFGDREYYCQTMLTIFKPWRSGKDLRLEDQSWDETFVAHNFTKHQLQLMENFNLRYECADARDDFSAQLKKGKGNGGMFPQWMTTDVMEDIDECNRNAHGDDFGDDEGPEDMDYGVNKYLTLGPHGAAHKAQMDAAESSVRGAGWLDDSPDGLYSMPKNFLEPEIDQPSARWKASVQAKRQEILAEKSKHMTSTTSSRQADLNADNVTVVDQSYLTAGFKAKSKRAQGLINKTVKDFSLNKEQERAFRVIANHSVLPEAEQLKMYMGGMGGTGKSQVIRALTT